MLQILFGGFIWTVRNYHTGGGPGRDKTLLRTQTPILHIAAHTRIHFDKYIYTITEDE